MGVLPDCVMDAELVAFCTDVSPWGPEEYRFARAWVIERMMRDNANPPNDLKKCMLKSLGMTYMLVARSDKPGWEEVLTEEEMAVLNREGCLPLGIMICNFDRNQHYVQHAQTFIRSGFGVFRSLIYKLSEKFDTVLVPDIVWCLGGVWSRSEYVWRTYLGEAEWAKTCRPNMTMCPL